MQNASNALTIVSTSPIAKHIKIEGINYEVEEVTNKWEKVNLHKTFVMMKNNGKKILRSKGKRKWFFLVLLSYGCLYSHTFS